MRAPITIPLMSPSAGVAKRAPTKARPARPIPSTSRRRSSARISGSTRCSPAFNVRLKVAVSSPLSTASATKLKSTCLSVAEKLVTVNSLWKFPVSMMTGRVCPVVPTREDAVRGKTKEPSELKLSLMTP